MVKKHIIPAVVVGTGVNGLGVIRSLNSGEVRVITLTDRIRDICRYANGAGLRYEQSIEGAALIESLAKIRDELGVRPALFLTQERSLKAISEFRDQVNEYVRFKLPPRNLVEQLLDKRSFDRLATQFGLVAPTSIDLTVGQSLEGIRALNYPAILKPATKDEAYVTNFKKAYIVNSYEEAEQQFRTFEQNGVSAVLQEWIDGPDSDIVFALGYFGGNGECLGMFSGRKLLSYPPKFGGTAACIPVSESMDHIERITKKFFQSVGFEGMASMEFKYCRDDRKYYVIEPTICRTDYQSELATINGCNLPLIQYCDLVGDSLPEFGKSKTKYGWIDREATKVLKARGISLAPLHDSNLKMKNSLFRISDPLPFLAATVHRVLSKLDRVGNRLLRIFGF